MGTCKDKATMGAHKDKAVMGICEDKATMLLIKNVILFRSQQTQVGAQGNVRVGLCVMNALVEL
jgi:hypothetical protein